MLIPIILVAVIIFLIVYINKIKSSKYNAVLQSVKSSEKFLTITATDRAFIYSLIGGFLGLFIAKFILLDSIEQMAWSFFWENLDHLHSGSIGDIISSSTFLKCATGSALGGYAGFRFAKKQSAQSLANNN